MFTLSPLRFLSSAAVGHAPAASDTLTLHKSIFQAYAIKWDKRDADHPNLSPHMKSECVPKLLEDLHAAEPRTRRASHAMYAWRVRPDRSTPTPLVGSSNGGEAGAGERLERLLELGHCEDVVLVVFRWYGGVKLGSDRWKCISSVAKEALDRGGFLSRPSGEDGDQAPKGKRRK
ncbi:ribosomal protein S5 domain 2-like protein [Epithele typhae]|uniref:ribosomal protein S5 domain 2-like protein n=1 Tax=Epithele typhae TaxID=378194 RepID=UPI002008C129|nr:ribosomal protein S5 domain 2-like protein [Epithele typhae]KAH9936864.1 ribosomal protein S5 domain 2-like protein [Epithele typhae]